MDSLTAIRNFADHKYTPAKRVKIFANRWYRVRMQNIERGPGDYLGLGEGEYFELLPGNKARKRRDAHLNHCNGITEYNGPVWEAFANQYGGEVRSIGWFESKEIALDAITCKKNQHDKWIADCIADADRHHNAAEAIRNGVGKSIMSPELHEQAEQDCWSCVTRNRDAFRCDIKAVNHVR